MIEEIKTYEERKKELIQKGTEVKELINYVYDELYYIDGMNNVLAKNRADTLSKALKKYSLFKNAPILNKEENNNVSDRSTGGDVSSIEAKKSRFTKISIIVNDKDVVKNIKDSEEKQASLNKNMNSKRKSGNRY